MNDLHVEKWLTFTLVDGKWDIQLWADSAKVYRLRIKVAAELIGEVEATASDRVQEKKFFSGNVSFSWQDSNIGPSPVEFCR